MAKIVLNVELNNQIGKEVEKIKTSLQGIQIPKTSLANTAQLEKSYANLFNTIKNSKGAYPEDVFKGVAEQVNKNLQAIKGLNATFKSNGELTKQEKQLYSQLKKELNQLSAQFATMRAETNKLEKTNKLAIPSVDNLRKRYADLLNTIKNTEKYYKKGTFDKITTDAKGYLEKLKGLDSTSDDYAENVNELDKNLNKLSADFAEARQSATNFHGSLQDIVSGFLKFQMAAMLVMKPLNLIRKAWASINETLVKTEDAVVSLQRVLNDDSLSDETISGKLYDLAAKYGQTFENANSIAQNFARTGMNWNETIKATEAGLLALNVAELDATQASDGMIAIMQQFGYEASNLTGIIDILNKTADNYAVTTDKLLTALQRTGSSAKNANLSLEQTVGIVTALSEATGRSGENLGTAVNSLIQFSTKSSALDTFAKLSDNMATLVDDFRHGKGTVLDIWQGLSTEIKNTNGSNESILSGLFGDDDWRSLNEELQEALGENFAKVTEIYDTASTFRKNYFIALLNNMDTVENAIGTASDAQGYSNKENEKYLDTYTAKVNTLKAKWQAVANDEQGLLRIKKTLIDIASSLLDFLKGIGGIQGALQIAIAVASPFLTKWAIVFGAKALSLLKSNIVSLFNAITTGAISANAALGIIGVALGAIVTAVNAVKSSIEQAEEARKQWIEETNQSSKEAVSSLENIKTKIGEISQGYLKLANASNEYTKTLTEQEAKQQKIAEQEAKQQAKQYLDNNYSKIYNAENLLSNKSDSTDYVLWGEGLSGYYSESDKAPTVKEINLLLKKYGIEGLKAEYNTEGFFGTEGGGITLSYNDKTLEEAMSLYQQLYDAIEKEGWGKNGTDKQGYFRALLQDFINAKKNDITPSRELLDNVKPYQDFVDGLISYDEFLKQIGVTVEETTEVVKSWADQSKEVVKNYQDILDIINETRDAQKSIVDLEEKKLELQKAQQALEDARNNRNVRVFNASTGIWELQADRSAIADAEEAVKKAEEDLEDATWTVLENEIKEGNMTAGDIYEKVKEIAVDLPNLAKTIRDAFVAQGYKMPEYDSGGVLRGLGGIKATSQDEIVLPPSITKQILQPSSNAEFAQFAKSLGLLFGSSKQVADMRSGMVVNNGGSTSTDNRSYIANGVPFSKEIAETHTIAELFEMAANFNN